MRITHGVMVNGFLTDMNRNLDGLNSIRKQLNTGKVFSKPSDDPFKVARSMQMYSEINANKQYNTNIKDTINWMDTTDTALSNATKNLQRVRELMVSAGNAAYGSSELSAIKDEINERVAEFGQILNTSFDGKYIFGGKDGAKKPVSVLDEPVQIFGEANKTKVEVGIGGLDSYNGSITKLEIKGIEAQPSGEYNVKINNEEYIISDDGSGNYMLDTAGRDLEGLSLDFTNIIKDMPNTEDTWSINLKEMKNSLAIENNEKNINQSLRVEISAGVYVEYNVNASEILKFNDSDANEVNVMDFFDELVNNLSSSEGKSEVVGDNLKEIDKIINNMLSISSKVGTIQNRMESAKELNEAQNENMTEILSANEDIDFVEKTMEMSVAQTIYTAALQTSAKVLQPSLLSYI